jgi:hypothetical protein
MPSSSITISRNGKIAVGNDGLSIEYRGVDSCPYGKTATANKQTFTGVVIHHTAPDHDIDWYVQYQIDGDPVRGGHFGYHFYIGQDGGIIQGAPLTKRTNHIKPSNAKQRKAFRREVNNTNALGISCVGAGMPDFKPTEEQLASVFELAHGLCNVLDISHENIVGHGEIQTDRNETEGAEPAALMRQGSFPDAVASAVMKAKRILTNDDMDDQSIADLERAWSANARQVVTSGQLEDAGDGADENEDLNVVTGDTIKNSDDCGSASLPFAPGISKSAAPTNNTFVAHARDGLNVRSGPGAEFPIIRSLPFGTEVQVVRREGRWGLIDELGDGAIDGAVYLGFLDSVRTAAKAVRELSADEVRTFLSTRNPRGARLYNTSNSPLVDPQLLHASAEGIGLFESRNPNHRVEIYGPASGFRTSGSVANHGAQPGTGRGAALDFVIIDLVTGRWLTNHPGSNHQYQGTVGQCAPMYQKLYNEVVRAGLRSYSDFDQKARFGGYFKNGSNALDTMHIDMRLPVGAAGGTLRDGFFSSQMTTWGIPANHPYV